MTGFWEDFFGVKGVVGIGEGSGVGVHELVRGWGVRRCRGVGGREVLCQAIWPWCGVDGVMDWLWKVGLQKKEGRNEGIWALFGSSELGFKSGLNTRTLWT